MNKTALRALESRLGFTFTDQSLLLTALTHPSYAGDHHVAHYQRLEFLGDAVLEMSVSRMLYDAYPQLSEGQLTRLRSALVREESLCGVAQELDLGPMLRLSVGETRSGGAQKPSILADVVESVLAAVYLDGGFDAAFALVDRLLKKRMPQAEPDGLDDKSRLQEALQRRGEPSPEYELIGQGGPDHMPVFTVCVKLGDAVIGEGSGHSKRAAQQVAAREALERLEDQ